MAENKLEHTVLFPTNAGTNLSHVFEVTHRPVVLKAFNVPPYVDLVLEMSSDVDCETIWGPFKPHCCNIMLNDSRNVIVLGLSGKYRVFIHNPNEMEIDDMVLTQNVVGVYSPIPDYCKCGGVSA